MRMRSLVIVLGLLLAPASRAAPALLAPVYPGAMHDRLADDDHYRFFFGSSRIRGKGGLDGAAIERGRQALI